MDVSIEHEDELWIGSPKNEYIQKVLFDNIPKYCKRCHKHGHLALECLKLTPPPMNYIVTALENAVVVNGAEGNSFSKSPSLENHVSTPNDLPINDHAEVELKNPISVLHDISGNVPDDSFNSETPLKDHVVSCMVQNKGDDDSPLLKKNSLKMAEPSSHAGTTSEHCDNPSSLANNVLLQPIVLDATPNLQNIDEQPIEDLVEVPVKSYRDEFDCPNCNDKINNITMDKLELESRLPITGPCSQVFVSPNKKLNAARSINKDKGILQHSSKDENVPLNHFRRRKSFIEDKYEALEDVIDSDLEQQLNRNHSHIKLRTRSHGEVAWIIKSKNP